MDIKESFDVFIIGAGPGGYTAAILAAKKGLSVGIADGSRLGGTCTNTGCIPTKAYIESVNLLNKIRKAAKFGIEVEDPSIDFSKMKSRKDRIITRLSKGIEYLLKQSGVDIFPTPADIMKPGLIKVGDTLFNTKHIIIATGSRPKALPILSEADVWTTDRIFDLKVLPESLAIIGGGVIGMEMAHVFSSLDVKVTIIEACTRILPLEDKHISECLIKNYRKVAFLTSARIANKNGTGPYSLLIDTPEGKKVVDVDKILLCIGRQPIIPAGSDEAGIARTASGGIRVDEFMQTSVPGIYAIGDVTGDHMYAYVASREATIAVDHISGGSKKISYLNIPSIIFTSPEIASVGDVNYMDTGERKVGTFPVSALGRARTMDESEGYAYISCYQDGRIERISIVAPHATELIPWATLAVDRGLSVTEFLEPYCPHPVMAELLKEAAEDSIGLSVHHE